MATEAIRMDQVGRDLRRIMILDTNALDGDTYLIGPGMTTLVAASDENLLEGVEIWTLRGVVEELVRQFPERLNRMRKVLGAISHDLTAL